MTRYMTYRGEGGEGEGATCLDDVPDKEQGEEFFVGTGGVGGLTQALLGRAVPGVCGWVGAGVGVGGGVSGWVRSWVYLVWKELCQVCVCVCM